MNKTITVCIATYNSQKYLDRVLKSIRDQTYSQDKVKILIVDGGSTDTTVSIAQKYDSRILKNSRVEPVYAKFLGYKESKTDYLIYLDHDEVLENKESFQLKVDVLNRYPNVYAVLSSGYTIPHNSSFINRYISEYGDPFSFYMYRSSKNSRTYFKEMYDIYGVKKIDNKYAVLDFSKRTNLPLIELSSAGSLINLKKVKKDFMQIEQDSELIPQLFYLTVSKQSTVAITVNDAVIHYSSDSFHGYKKKLLWRIKNNIFFKNSVGRAGFSGRQTSKESSINKFKSHLFIPYTYSLILPIVDSLFLAWRNKNLNYIVHTYLCLYVATYIMYFYLLAIIRVPVLFKNYDDTKTIKE